MTTAANPTNTKTPAGKIRPGQARLVEQPAVVRGRPSGIPTGIGRPIAIAAIVFLLAAGHLGRMLFWPVALAALIFMVASGRFGCRRRRMWAARTNGAGPRAAIPGSPRRPGQVGAPGATGAAAATTVDDRKRPPAATTPSTNTAPKPSAVWRRSNRSSPASSNASASPRTRPSSTSSWPTAARPHGPRRSLTSPRTAEPAYVKPTVTGG